LRTPTAHGSWAHDGDVPDERVGVALAVDVRLADEPLLAVVARLNIAGTTRAPRRSGRGGEEDRRSFVLELDADEAR
jgi:hypothetical protein